MAEKILVDVNRAEETELTSIPGVGPALAHRIIQSRPYISKQDLSRVSGISHLTVERMEPYFIVESDMQQTEESLAEDMQVPAVPELPEDETEGVPATSPDHALAVEAPPPLPLPVIVPELDEESAVLDNIMEADEESMPVEPVTPVKPVSPERPIPPGIEPMAETNLLNIVPEPAAEVNKDEEKSPEPKKPAPASVGGPKLVTRGQLIWVSLLILVFAMAFGIALTLGILSGINGGLRYVAPEQVAAISRDVSNLSTRAGAMQGTLDSVQARLDNLEALSGRIDALETTTGGLQTDVKGLKTDVQSLDGMLKDLSAQTEALRSDMDAIAAQATRFQGVMDGLRDLLNNLFPVTK